MYFLQSLFSFYEASDLLSGKLAVQARGEGAYTGFTMLTLICNCLFMVFVQWAVLGGRTPPAPLVKTVLFHCFRPLLGGF